MIWKLDFRRSTDFVDLYFGATWKQTAYVIGDFATSIPNRTEELYLNGDGDEIIISSRTAIKRRFEFVPVMDCQILGFLLIRDCDEVTLTNVDSGEVFTLEEIEVQVEKISLFYNKVSLIFKDAVDLSDSCGVNYIKVGEV